MMSTPFFTECLLAPRWVAVESEPVLALPKSIRSWLVHRASMTEKLQQATQKICRVHVRKQGLTALPSSLHSMLGSPEMPTVWLREVVLSFDSVPLMHAQTWAPSQTLTGPHAAVMSLDTQPLGRHLFTAPEVERQWIQCASIHPTHAPYAVIAASLNETPSAFWQRRSCFYLSGRPLLLIEAFASRVFDLPTTWEGVDAR